jgi:hypothetical protein
MHGNSMGPRSSLHNEDADERSLRALRVPQGRLREAISHYLCSCSYWPPKDCFVALGLPAIASLCSLRRGGRAPRNDFKDPSILVFDLKFS